MPQYRYRCSNCGAETRLIRPVEQRVSPVECGCGSQMALHLTGLTTIAKEVVDSYRNVRLKVGHREEVERRAREHFIERGEMDELIRRHGVDHAIGKGWITPDGKRKTKFDLK